MKIAIVAPVHLPVSNEWSRSLELVATKSNADVIIVDDSDGNVTLPASFKVFDYAAQQDYLGYDLYMLFEKFHKSSACKTFGMLYAYREGYDMVMVIDSDCIVPPSFTSVHQFELFNRWESIWQNPIEVTSWESRGYPKFEGRSANPIAHMGLWENELDLWGIDRALNSNQPPKELPEIYGVVRGIVPFSGMNLAMPHRAIPGFLFLPNAEYGEYKFRRHDDIWGGYIFQQFMKKRWEVMTFGRPYVKHDTVVVPAEDAKAEEGMIAMELAFYEAVDDVMRHVKPGGYEDMFAQFSEAASRYPAEHIIRVFTPAFDFWVRALKTV